MQINLSLKLVSKGETWVILKIVKENLFSRNVKTGGTESQTVDLSSESLKLLSVVGNAADTEIYVNDQKLRVCCFTN